MKIVSFTLLMFMFTLLCTGCGFKDIDKRFFVVAVGFDQSGNKEKPIKVTLKLGVPFAQVEPGKSNLDQIEFADAKTVSGAIDLLEAKTDKKLDFSHASIFIVGEEVAKANIKDITDWIFRQRDVQQIAYISIGSPTAENILKVKPPSERLPGNALFLSFGDEGADSQYLVSKNITSYFRENTEKGISPILPVIEANDHGYNINHVAILSSEKINLMLTPDETRILKTLTTKYKNYDVDVLEPEVFHYHSSKTSVKKKMTKGGIIPGIEIQLKLYGSIQEVDSNLSDKSWKELEDSVSKTVEHDIDRLLKKLQKSGVDPVGFGLLYRAKIGDKKWGEWDAYYPDVHFNVKVETRITGSGIIKK